MLSTSHDFESVALLAATTLIGLVADALAALCLLAFLVAILVNLCAAATILAFSASEFLVRQDAVHSETKFP